MIVVALIVVNIAAILICSRRGIVFYDILILECYSGLGAIIGSKILFLCTVFKEVNWTLFFSDYSYFSSYMNGGFVFFGGLLGAVPMVLFGSRIHGISISEHIDIFGFLIPLGHAFGRIGCFLAGCCYGIEGDSPISVVFPEGSFAPPHVHLIPVQLIESSLLFLISAIVFIWFIRKRKHGAFRFYVIAYCVVRFIDEFLRGDANRGIILELSTSQWICIIVLLSLLIEKKVSQRAKRLSKKKCC